MNPGILIARAPTDGVDQAGPRRDRARYRIDVLVRGFQILECVSRSDGFQSARDLAQQIGLPVTTTRRLALALAAEGYLARDRSGRFALTLKLLDLGYGGHFGLALSDIVRVPALELHHALQASVFVSIFAGVETISILSLIQSGFVQPLPHRFPLVGTSSGKAFLAFVSPERRKKILDAVDWRPFAPNTIRSRPQLEAELERIRERGFAYSNEELVAGVVSIGAPIFHAGGEPIAAISAQTAVGEGELEAVEARFAAPVRNSAALLSERLTLMELDEDGGASARQA